jgi:hypothetical protein
MTTPTMAEPHAVRTGFVAPLILIGLGVLFLLNNLGVLDWSIWEVVFQYWPVLLIAVGLDILVGRRSTAGSLLVGVVMILLIGLGIWWLGPRSLNGMPLTAQTINQPLEGATRGEVALSLGVGTLQLEAMQEPEGLIAGTIETQYLDRLIRESSKRGDTAVFVLRYRDSIGSGQHWARGDHWNVQLNGQVPTNLLIDTGVGTARLNLAELQIPTLGINAGVGDTFVTVPRQGVVNAQISGGVGQVMVTLPQGMAAKVTVNKGLGSITMPPNYVQNDNTYTSPGYDTATNRIELSINGGVGNIQVKTE